MREALFTWTGDVPPTAVIAVFPLWERGMEGDFLNATGVDSDESS